MIYYVRVLDQRDLLLLRDAHAVKFAGLAFLLAAAVAERAGVAWVVQHLQHQVVLKWRPVKLALALAGLLDPPWPERVPRSLLPFPRCEANRLVRTHTPGGVGASR